MTQIEPKEVGVPTKTATKLDIKTIYNIGGNDAFIYWRLVTESNEQVAEGNLVLSEEILSTWGIDDSPVVDFVINSLGLVKLVTE